MMFISTTLHVQDIDFFKEDIFCSQDELKSFCKNVANHFLYVNLVDFTKGKAKGRVISNSIELPFETYRKIYQKVRTLPI